MLSKNSYQLGPHVVCWEVKGTVRTCAGKGNAAGLALKPAHFPSLQGWSLAWHLRHDL